MPSTSSNNSSDNSESLGKLVLPLSPVPPISFFHVAAFCDPVIFDAGEHYVKQTVRNRYHILTANGVQAPTIPVRHTGRLKTPTGKVEVDHRKPWSTNHIRAIEAAYRSAPYYAHYAPTIQALLSEPHENLYSFFAHAFPVWQRLLGVDFAYTVSLGYIEKVDGTDGRGRYKKPSDLPPEWAVPPYPQVFEDRYGYCPNLSVIDLLMNEGPAARDCLFSDLKVQ